MRFARTRALALGLGTSIAPEPPTLIGLEEVSMSWFFVAVFAGASYWYVRKRRQRKTAGMAQG
jgi:hypothetical protein